MCGSEFDSLLEKTKLCWWPWLTLWERAFPRGWGVWMCGRQSPWLLMTKNPQKLCQSTVEMFTTWKFAMLVRPQLLLHLVLVFSLELLLWTQSCSCSYSCCPRCTTARPWPSTTSSTSRGTSAWREQSGRRSWGTCSRPLFRWCFLLTYFNFFSQIDILRIPQSLARIVWGGAKGKSTCR